MELWDAYTVDGVPTGDTLVRGEAIPEGLFHLVCEVLVRHTDGSYLVMKRSREKPNFPGWEEATAGGSALKGEDPLACIRRELEEETGLQCTGFTQISRTIARDGKSIFYGFTCTVDCPKDAVRLQEGETESYRWLSEAEFIRFVNSNAMVPTQKRRNLSYFKKLGYLPPEYQVELTPAELTDNGICPTCFDRANDYCLYGDPTEKRLYENELFDCVLVGAPRADGHTAIISKAHYKDMMEIPEDLCREMYAFARRVMQALKTVYGAQSVYLCTMCDGPMNHFHIQLIPRYPWEKRGSMNFVKDRMSYRHDSDKIEALRAILK